ncbi:hypothetical protein [Teichococcus rhizosphaerae]|uniref:hypothetical protein n=1 Tax=Teichococcus rhizosphaerae TaxID=1335062 RepID=UPI001145E440
MKRIGRIGHSWARAGPANAGDSSAAPPISACRRGKAAPFGRSMVSPTQLFISVCFSSVFVQRVAAR